LHVRQIGWLHAVPKLKRGKPGEASRLDMLEQAGKEPDLPPAGPAAYLLSHLWEAGPVAHTGMGPLPLSWQDLQSWQQMAGAVLLPWEARTLRRLSSEYLRAMRDGEAHDAPPPWAPDVTTAERREQVAKAVSAIFGGRARAAAVVPAKAHQFKPSIRKMP